jgi:sulfotransferase family protein
MAQQSDSAGDEARKETGAKQKKPTSAYRKLRRKFAKTRLRAPLVWLNHRNLSPTDVFIASYPKSGVTWTRFVLFEILSGLPAGFKTTNQLMTGVGKHNKGLRLLPGGGRLVGTHEQYRKNYNRAIYVVRDARDVLLSEFAFLSALDYFHGDLDKFISTFLFTCGSAYGYGPWHRHVFSWLDSPIGGTENLLLVRYEDLRKDPVAWFTRMAEFLGVGADHEKIELAVANNSLQKMQEKERKEPVRASIRGRFVRNGTVRGWVSHLSPEQVRLIEEHAGSALLRLGYPLSSQLGAEELAPVMINQVGDTTCRV